MFDLDKWQEIANSIRKQKMRTALTAFGVFWGIFMLVLLLGFGSGFGNRVDRDFGAAKNVVVLFSSNPTQIPYQGLSKGRRINLTQDDIDAIKQNVNNLEIIDGRNMLGNKSVNYKKENASFRIMGTHPHWEGIEFIKVIQGRYINRLDEKQWRKVAVISERTKELLFKQGEEPLGESININGVYFVVVGIYKSTQVGNDDQDGGAIFLPNETLRRAFNAMDSFGNIIFTPKPGISAFDVEREVKKIIFERNKVHPDDTGVLGGFNMERYYQQNKGLVTGIIGFSWLVAIGTIIAGVIGVGNIMLVIVKERTREIGLRKAMGATPLNISLMILQESLVITLVAGYMGLAAGVFLLEGLTALFVAVGAGNNIFATPYIDIGTAMIALCVLVGCGVAAAVLPAMKAASVNPITALQDE